ncbi:hypothetical protein EV193_10157 [Herbihabitans rhizosphaerae]|uniref:Uncharacterized protein n=1 Tax=Herbihabitans rhizosphaerae TaxID=1872711 RepID=A0A4Q7L774_9PSEU|nr:hypothetical protein [Herbihabitans rhizosphaerae]RZS44182.1 hypothetical protein EV193_10157 [Herbihabitans rhizosphaerae]
MLEAASRSHWFKVSYDISESGRPVATLAARDRSSCAFDIAGASYVAAMANRKEFRLHGPNGVEAWASRHTRRRWLVQTPAGTALTLVLPSMWNSTWELHQNDRVIGYFEAKMGWGRMRGTAHLPQEMPLPERLFIYYVVLTFWLQASQAAASASV